MAEARDPSPGCHVAIANNTAAPTTTTRTTIDAMCTLTIDCRCDTCIDGMTRYQWPRIIAVHAPPSSAAELRKLATVSARTGDRAAGRNVERLQRRARRAPPTTATPTIAGRIDASVRPTVAQYTTIAALATSASAASAAVPTAPIGRRHGDRNASATAIRIAASPALKRKNFTPASRETSASVKTIPTPRCARKRKRTVDRDMGRWGRAGG